MISVIKETRLDKDNMRKMVIMARNNGITPFGTFGIDSFDPFDDLLLAPFTLAPRRDLRKVFDSMEKSFRCDVKETDDAYEISVDIPGADKNDIDVDLNSDNVLTIAYKHEDGENKEDKDDEGNVTYHCRERSTVSGSRSFKIADADRDNVHASYTDGVLTVTVGKVKETEPEKKSIDIE